MLSADSFGMKRLQPLDHPGKQLSDQQGRAGNTPQAAGLGIGHSAELTRQLQVFDAKHVHDRTRVLEVLVVDDDESIRRVCGEIVTSLGFHVTSAGDVAQATAILERQAFDLLLLDLKLPGTGGSVLLEAVKRMYPETGVVMMTAFATVPSAVEAIRNGAGDYLTKPFTLEELRTVLRQADERRGSIVERTRLRERLRIQISNGSMIGRSPEMEKLYRLVAKVVPSTHPVLILGESGTGKELVARAIHSNGPNASKPFVPVDCGALAPTLIESELFGYVKGAFTGANQSKEGLLTAAGGGTVFLDEIGELPLDLQAKLLRALQEKEVRPVGATQAVPILARILSATHRDLPLMVEQGRFRKDLYYRLNVVNIKIPALRERKADIVDLANLFLERHRKDIYDDRHFSQKTLQLLLEYDWPGNVRELQNAVEHVAAVTTVREIEIAHLPTQLVEFYQQTKLRPTPSIGDEAVSSTINEPLMRQGSRGSSSIADMERQAILGTIQHTHGDKLMAAKLLGIGKTTLYRKLKEYGLSKGDLMLS